MSEQLVTKRDIEVAFGQRIKEALLELGISQKELGVLLFPDGEAATNAVTISKMLNGKTKRISIGVLAKLCEITGKDANYFIFGINQ